MAKRGEDGHIRIKLPACIRADSTCSVGVFPCEEILVLIQANRHSDFFCARCGLPKRKVHNKASTLSQYLSGRGIGIKERPHIQHGNTKICP